METLKCPVAILFCDILRLYYDRTPKFDMKRIHAIFSKTPEAEAE